MTEAGLRHFLCKQGLADNRVDLLKLKGGYLNTVWRVDTGTRRLVAKHFAAPMTGTHHTASGEVNRQSNRHRHLRRHQLWLPLFQYA